MQKEFSTTPTVPKRVRSALVAQAKRDYQEARGTAHLALMRRAHMILVGREKNLQARLSDLRRQETELRASRDRELAQQLTKVIVENEIIEVNGIGPGLRDRILQKTFRGRFEDLYDAHLGGGIGEERQRAINDWVRRKQQELPRRLNGPFRGKEQILQTHTTKGARLRQDIEAAEQQHKAALRERELLEAYMRPLERVTERDFAGALAGSPEKASVVERYLHGAFPAWEPVPDWFQSLVLTHAESSFDQFSTVSRSRPTSKAVAFHSKANTFFGSLFRSLLLLVGALIGILFSFLGAVQISQQTGALHLFFLSIVVALLVSISVYRRRKDALAAPIRMFDTLTMTLAVLTVLVAVLMFMANS